MEAIPPTVIPIIFLFFWESRCNLQINQKISIDSQFSRIWKKNIENPIGNPNFLNSQKFSPISNLREVTLTQPSWKWNISSERQTSGEKCKRWFCKMIKKTVFYFCKFNKMFFCFLLCSFHVFGFWVLKFHSRRRGRAGRGEKNFS